MDEPTALIWADDDLDYDFGPDHPLKPVRVELCVGLIRACGLTEAAHVRTLPRDPFDTDAVLRVHEAAYVDVVRELSARDPAAGGGADAAGAARGFGMGDNPVFSGMHDASLEVCGASVAAARLVWEGEVAHAFNPAGGLHHAMRDRAAGFCIYNDPAIAIAWLLDHGAARVAYVDVDTHHGDGVQDLFYEDPRVLTISLHESGRYLFPGTGFPDEIGAGDARGTSLNVPLPPLTTGPVYLEAFDEVVGPALDAFGADVLVTQLGCDTHVTDPLAHLALTTDDYVAIADRLHRLAHTHARGRWVATGGGGYQVAAVVPRAWTIAFAELTGQPLPERVPEEWLERAAEVARAVRLDAPPPTFAEGAVTIAADRERGLRQEVRGTVEQLKRAAFDLLERHT